MTLPSGTRYEEWAPPASLSEFVVCTWAARHAPDGTAHTQRVLPDGCMDIVWDGGSLFVAGPDTGPVTIEGRPGGLFVGIRFRPGAAPSFLDCRADEVRDRRVDLAAVWDTGAAAELQARVAERNTLPAAAALLAETVEAALPDARPTDPLVAAVVEHHRSPVPGNEPLARMLDVHARTLHRRCTAQLGYGPATLGRVLRFRRLLALHERYGGSLARLAAAAGYADQAHLTRETRRLAGVTPRQLFAAEGVRTVQDALVPVRSHS
jgi:AraC-like DNA-binding protein